MRVRRAALKLVAVVALAWPGSAAAAETIALFPFEGFFLPAALEMAPLELTATVGGRLTAAGHEVKEPSLLLRDAMGAVSCTTMDAACASSLGAFLVASSVVVGKMERAGDAVRIRVRKFRTSDGALTEIEEVVPATAAALTAAFGRLADRLVSPVSRVAGPTAPPAPRVAPPPAESAPPPHRGRFAISRPGVALLAAGVVALGISAWTGSRTAATQEAFDAIPRESAEHFEELSRLERRGRTHAAVTTALIAAGAAAVAAGGALVTLRLLRRGGTEATVAATPGGVYLVVRTGGLAP